VSSQPTPPRAHPSGQPQVFRLTAPRVLWWAWLVFALANITGLVFGAPARFALDVAALLATITGVMYACALRPRLVADDSGILIQNPLRDIRVPWGTVAAVDVSDWVRVRCVPAASQPGGSSQAGGMVIESWALFAPARKRLRPQRSAADVAIRSAAGARLPDGAKILMSVSAQQAVAMQLDERAARERHRGAAPSPPLVRWAWPAVAGMIIPALTLIAAVLA
jgi:Bacterial PH domain